MQAMSGQNVADRPASIPQYVRLAAVLYTLPWDARHALLQWVTPRCALRLARTCQTLYTLIRGDDGLWHRFYMQHFLRYAQQSEHEFFEWYRHIPAVEQDDSECSSNDGDRTESEEGEDEAQLPGHLAACASTRVDGAFASAHAQLRQESSAHAAAERTLDWYAAFRRRILIENNWRTGQFTRHSIQLSETSRRANGGVIAHQLIAGSVSGLLIMQGERLYGVYQPHGQGSTFYRVQELDLEAETAGILQVSAAHMSGRWVVVELHDPQYPDAGGSISAWRVGEEQAACAAELKEGGERVQALRDRWALLTRHRHGAAHFSVVDLERGLRSIDELSVCCRSAELLRVDKRCVQLLVSEYHGPNDNDAHHELDSLAQLPLVDPSAASATATAMGVGGHATASNRPPSQPYPVPYHSAAIATSIICTIYRLSVTEPPMLIRRIHLPAPPYMLGRSLRLRVVDFHRVLLEYIEANSYEVCVTIGRLDTLSTLPGTADHLAEATDVPPSSQGSAQRSECHARPAPRSKTLSSPSMHTVLADMEGELEDEGEAVPKAAESEDGKGIVLISWYRRRHILICGDRASWVGMGAQDVASSYLVTPSLGRIGLLFHSEYFEGDAALVDMATWQPLCKLGYWEPAVGPSLVTPTFIARLKESDNSLEIWDFAA